MSYKILTEKRYQELKLTNLKTPIFQSGHLTPEAEEKWNRWMKLAANKESANKTSPTTSLKSENSTKKTFDAQHNTTEIHNLTDSIINTLLFFNETAKLVLDNVPNSSSNGTESENDHSRDPEDSQISGNFGFKTSRGQNDKENNSSSGNVEAIQPVVTDLESGTQINNSSGKSSRTKTHLKKSRVIPHQTKDENLDDESSSSETDSVVLAKKHRKNLRKNILQHNSTTFSKSIYSNATGRSKSHRTSNIVSKSNSSISIPIFTALSRRRGGFLRPNNQNVKIHKTVVKHIKPSSRNGPLHNVSIAAAPKIRSTKIKYSTNRNISKILKRKPIINSRNLTRVFLRGKPFHENVTLKSRPRTQHNERHKSVKNNENEEVTEKTTKSHTTHKTTRTTPKETTKYSTIPRPNQRVFWPATPPVTTTTTTVAMTSSTTTNRSATRRTTTPKGIKPCLHVGKDCIRDIDCCTNHCKYRRGRAGICDHSNN